MNNVNKTLYIPLYGKAYVSKKGLFLQDKKAEEIWASEGFALKGKSRSKWLAYYMGIRASMFDRWVTHKMSQDPNAVVVQIGCGMDSRCQRVGVGNHRWYDVDFPDVIAERHRYYCESPEYTMLSGDVRDCDWLSGIPKKSNAIVIMEGVSMYLTPEELRNLIKSLCRHFARISLLMDCYTVLAAKMSKYKNPINDVGVTAVYGLDDPLLLNHSEFQFTKEHDMTPPEYTNQLQGMEKYIFRKLYAGSFAKKLYRLFEYQKTQEP